LHSTKVSILAHFSGTMNSKIRKAIGPVSFAVAVGGGLFLTWDILRALMAASEVTKLMLGAAAAGGGSMATVIAWKAD